uniref:Uncharacterized protein n=1 Tax=Setaria viridis TaxID=4556 RepID=A0A4U6URW6_SETVI|nr:hypothetical protein SEVIR_4G000332v2 [Setaria viridis]
MALAMMLETGSSTPKHTPALRRRGAREGISSVGSWSSAAL